MKLRCVSRYSSGLGSYEPGQVFDVSDAIGGEIQRSSPESFEEVVEREDPLEEAVDLVAMSTKTETDIVAPDRRGRGGKKRTRR